MAVKVSQITIIIRDQEMVMTVDEARALQRELGQVLGSEQGIQEGTWPLWSHRGSSTGSRPTITGGIPHGN